jgi:hypothetical protein
MPDQWQFLRGIYAVNPNTPPGLPHGDRAVVAQVEGNAGGLVFFIDGEKACTPMPIRPELLALIGEVATMAINEAACNQIAVVASPRDGTAQ